MVLGLIDPVPGKELEMLILTLNCGSSSVKYALYDTTATSFVCQGIVERIGISGGFIRHKIEGDLEVRIERNCPDHTEAVSFVFEILTTGDGAVVSDKTRIAAVGHRVVHGGEKFAHSARITTELIQAVEAVAELAPLHNPPNLAGIRAAQAVLPGAVHVAVFDTAFHQTMPPEAYIYPLPYDWYKDYGIRRYGFHGTSHLYVSRRAAFLMGRPMEELKIVTLHIGNGSSAAAIDCGRSVDTSMGFTPLEGLVMGTRCGWIDPAIPLYIAEKKGIGLEELDRLLNKESGILGITGRYSDRREVDRAISLGDMRSKLALTIECRVIKKTIGAYAAVMGGLDAVVFTAGAGEKSPNIRAGSLKGLEFLGIRIDAESNRRAMSGEEEIDISFPGSPVRVLVIPTNEELVIVEDTRAIVEGGTE